VGSVLGPHPGVCGSVGDDNPPPGVCGAPTQPG